MLTTIIRILAVAPALLLVACNSDVKFDEIPRTAASLDDTNSGSTGDGLKDGDGGDGLSGDAGVGFEKVAERFIQSDSEPKVDIVFVVDNSVSMSDEQAEMGEKIGSFLTHFRDINWQIGITTTDVSDGVHGIKGELVPLDATNSYILTKLVPDYEEVFRKSVLRKETLGCGQSCPSPNEEPLHASILAMEKHKDANAGFFRENSDLIFVYLTDENEMSTGPTFATQPDTVIAAAQKIFSQPKSMRAYGIIVEPGDQTCLQLSPDHRFGTFVADLAQKTGGSTGSLCSDSYAPVLGRIGEEIERNLSSIKLASEPVEASLPGRMSVSLRPAVAGAEWKVTGNRLNFSVQLPPGTEILVNYFRQK